MKLKVDLTEEQAWAFAQFLKRMGMDDYFMKSDPNSDTEQNQMYDAGEKIRKALSNAGYSPR